MDLTQGRPTYLEVDLARLENNLAHIRAHVHPAKVMVVLKANAYGHGVAGVAPRLAPQADYVGVAFVEEAIGLRQLGIREPILVLGGSLPGQVPLFVRHDLTLSASSLELLDAAEAVAQSSGSKLKVHLKIDTGMERLGVHDYDAKPFLERALTCRHIDVEGIFTHLANSEAADLRHAKAQLERFRHVLEFYERRGVVPPRLRHVANSGAILQLPESRFDMVRAGVILYGVYPGPDVQRRVDVEPAMTWRSQVAHSKITRPGRPVSYGSTWEPEKSTRILTVPCGYADGYFRRMSNTASVLVRGRRYSQVGRICMDHFMVDALDDEVEVGEEVILLGGAPSGERIAVEDLAEWAGTNEYEVMTNISARVPRRFTAG